MLFYFETNIDNFIYVDLDICLYVLETVQFSNLNVNASVSFVSTTGPHRGQWKKIYLEFKRLDMGSSYALLKKANLILSIFFFLSL